jgi:hypothetical protein
MLSHEGGAPDDVVPEFAAVLTAVVDERLAEEDVAAPPQIGLA